MAPSSLQKANVLEATLVVAGNIMGSGIFLVPVQLATIGSVSLLGWVFSFLGVSSLALVFARLSSGEDAAGGGAYGFCRKEFGPLVACAVNASYFLSVLFGNCAGAIVGVGYLTLLVPLDSTQLLVATIALIWAMTVLNVIGPRAVVRLQGVCTLLTCVPIFAVALFGWTSFDSSVFWESWNVAGVSDVVAVQRGLNIQLWAFTGLETAAAVSSVVRNPHRNVPIATCLGVLVAGLGYVLSCTVLCGLFSAGELSRQPAPFAAALTRIFPGFGSAAAVAAGVCAVVGCTGSLAGWMLVGAQSSAAASADGLFPASLEGPRGLVFTSTAMTAVVLACSLLPGHPFVLVASMSSLLTLVPYILTACALFAGRPAPGLFWSGACVVAVLFCGSALFGSSAWHVVAATALALGSSALCYMCATLKE